MSLVIGISNWYFGTDGNTPSEQFDFASVVLHELCHGLGFVGSMNVSEGIGDWGFSSGFPLVYDIFPVNGSGEQLIDTNLFPNPSPGLAGELTSDNIFFDGPNAVSANDSVPPQLYAPATWDEGSSYSHLDESTFPAGDPNSLMTPQIGMAEAIHSPGAITLGIFQDVGWALEIVGTEEEPKVLPRMFALSQNFPNPFNPMTTFEYRLLSSADVTFVVYNLLGREVAVLVRGIQPAGLHHVSWDGKTESGAPVASGLYFYRLEAREANAGTTTLFGQTRKMLLLR